jgi:hypothetical protein
MTAPHAPTYAPPFDMDAAPPTEPSPVMPATLESLTARVAELEARLVIVEPCRMSRPPGTGPHLWVRGDNGHLRCTQCSVMTR